LRKIASERYRSENHESVCAPSGITFPHGDFYEIPFETLKTQFDAKNITTSFIVKKSKTLGFYEENHNDSREMGFGIFVQKVRNFAFWRKSW
jgi:hypothetical protein